MFKRALCLSIVLLLTATMSCDDSDDNAAGPVVRSVEFSDFVHFDTSQNLIAKIDHGDDLRTPEIFLWWEEIIGEPFIDVNENGVYDAGIDIFIMGTGEDNMDLNHDGRYTGPDDPWEPGIPFDDIDGNDTCRVADYYYLGRSGPNVPYFDANGNGVLDSALDYRTLFLRPTPVIESDTLTSWRYIALSDTLVYFLSDSGFSYYADLGSYSCPICGGSGELILNNSGLHYYSSRAALVYGSYNLLFDILEDSAITSGTERISFLDHVDLPSYSREISLDQTLEMNGVIYSGLVKVRCDQIRWSIPNVEEDLEGAFWELYFSEEIGLAAIREKWSATSVTWQCCFEILDESLPILLKK